MTREKGKRSKRRQQWRDFWRAWKQEQRRLWEAGEGPPWDETSRPHPPFPPRQMARHWRSFFHEFMGTWPEHHWAFGGRRFNPWRQGKTGFNPFVASILSKGGGLLPLFVMHLLSQGPRYGNELMDLISEHTKRVWIANPGAIYPLMTMLEELGYVTGEWEDPRKRTVRIYALTVDGEQELNRLKAVVLPKLKEATEVLNALAGELSTEEI